MLQINNLSKYYGNFAAVDDLSMSLEKGKFLTMLGPSGSGKTTTLLSIAGFIFPDKGEIKIAGENVTNIPAYKRNIGMVFQNYALFPHMTVEENVMFPLKMRHVKTSEARVKASEMLGVVGLKGMGNRYPKQLSGGQQQRVALARALVYNPPILLMDEPLGALDKQLRQRMQYEIKHIQRSLGITVVYVTHDQEEALTMSDEVIIMNNGKIEQLGTPWELYESPCNKFVAEFMGESNLIKAEVVDLVPGGGSAKLLTNDVVKFVTDKELAVGDEIVISVRPEKLIVMPSNETHNVLNGNIKEAVYLGEASRFVIQLDEQHSLIVKQANLSFAQIGLQLNANITVGWKPEDGIVLTK